MKKISFLFVAGYLSLSLNCFSQIKVSSTGKVGINNTSPTYQFDVNGNFRVLSSGAELIFDYGQFYPSYNSWSSLGGYGNMWDELFATQAYFQNNPTILSDINAKKDVKDLPDIKDKLLSLRPVSYKLKPNFKGNEKYDLKIAKRAEESQLGLIAQEVREIFPGIVTQQEDGTLGIRYTELIPVLVKAFQEQQTEIEGLKARIEKLESGKK